MAVLVRRLSKKGLLSRQAGYDFDCRLLRPSPTAWPYIEQGRTFIDKPLADWTAEDLAAFHRVQKVNLGQVAERRMQANMMLQLSAQRYIEWWDDQSVERYQQINEQAETDDPRLLAPDWSELAWLQWGKGPPANVPPPTPAAR